MEGSNGVMSGLVGAMGNAGGVIFAVIFRLHPAPFGKAFWISGVVVMVHISFTLLPQTPKCDSEGHQLATGVDPSPSQIRRMYYYAMTSQIKRAAPLAPEAF